MIAPPPRLFSIRAIGFILFIVFVYQFQTSIAQATTYYVDSTITNTNSSSITPDCTTYNPATFTCSGGTDKAFATLADVNAFSSTTLLVGDSVLFRKGQAFQKITGTMTLQPGVTYGAFGTGANPRLEGAGLYPTWSLYSGNIYVASSTLADNVRFMVWEGDTRGTRQTSLGAVATSGDFYLDDPNNNLYYISRGGGNPNQYTIHADTNHNPFQINGNNGRIENITFAYAGAALLVTQSNSGALSGWVISGVRFTNSMLHGFGQFSGSSGTSLTFINSEFDHNVQYGFVAAGPYPTAGVVNTLFDNCSFHDNVLAGISLDGVGTATSSGNIIRNSVAYNNGGDGIAIGANGVDDIIQDSIAYDNGQLVDDRTGIKSFGLRTIIRRNVSYNNNLNFQTGHGFQFDTVASSGIMYNNIAYGNAAGGISFMGNGHKIYNNTVYNNHGKALASGGINTFGSGTYTNIEIKNNIIYNNGQSGVPGSRYQLYDSNHLNDPSNLIDHNLYFDTESHTSLVRFGSTNYATMGAFASATGRESHGLETDPLLTNTAGNDLTLSSSSPAIDSGTNLGSTYQLGLAASSTWPSSVLTLNQNTNGSGWERGAYVFFSAPSAPTIASTPSPAHASTTVATSTILSWIGGTGATSHGVYFGTTTSPTSSEYKGNQTGTTYDPGVLAASTTYYWRIDEANGVGTTTGSIWSFTTTQVQSTPSTPVVTSPTSTSGGGGGSCANCKSKNTNNSSSPTAGSSKSETVQATTTSATTTEVAATPDTNTTTENATGATIAPVQGNRFSKNLKYGDRDEDVYRLQQFLNGHGFTIAVSGPGASGSETYFFGTLTLEAVKRFQATYASEILVPAGLSIPSGYFGAFSLKKANSMQ